MQTSDNCFTTYIVQKVDWTCLFVCSNNQASAHYEEWLFKTQKPHRGGKEAIWANWEITKK